PPPHAPRPPSGLCITPSGSLVDRIMNAAPQAAELAIAEDTDHPGRIDLPVIAGTDGSEPSVATLGLMDAEGCARRCGPGKGICIPEAAANAAEDVEAGPIINGRHRRWSFGIGPGCEVGRRGRSGESRCRDESKQKLLHF